MGLGQTVDARDGAAIVDMDEVRVTAVEDSEVVLVEVARPRRSIIKPAAGDGAGLHWVPH